MPSPVSQDVSPVEPPKIVVLPGDGIGPEISDSAIQLLDRIGNIEIEKHLIGGCSIDKHGTALTDEVLEHCKASDSVLLGAVGGPKWDTTVPGRPRPEDGLLGLRKALGKGCGLYANLRPVRPYAALMSASPLRRERVEGTDLLIVRELTGGSYYGKRGRKKGRRFAFRKRYRRKGRTLGFDTCEYWDDEVSRVAKVAFEAAQQRRGKLTSIDKANVLESSRVWREVIKAVARAYPDVEVDHMLVDNAAMQLVARPSQFDVVLTENTFGDILSDQAAMISGSLGMLPSASIDHYPPGLFEPIHGSAPDIAGQGLANPLGTLLSVAMLFRYGLKRFPRAEEVADAIEQAVETVLDAGLRTADLIVDTDGDTPAVERVNTKQMTEAVIASLKLPDEPWTSDAKSREAHEEDLDENSPDAVANALLPA